MSRYQAGHEMQATIKLKMSDRTRMGVPSSPPLSTSLPVMRLNSGRRMMMGCRGRWRMPRPESKMQAARRLARLALRCLFWKRMAWRGMAAEGGSLHKPKSVALMSLLRSTLP